MRPQPHPVRIEPPVVTTRWRPYIVLLRLLYEHQRLIGCTHEIDAEGREV
jgi:hypothetical protein